MDSLAADTARTCAAIEHKSERVAADTARTCAAIEQHSVDTRRAAQQDARRATEQQALTTAWTQMVHQHEMAKGDLLTALTEHAGVAHPNGSSASIAELGERLDALSMASARNSVRLEQHAAQTRQAAREDALRGRRLYAATHGRIVGVEQAVQSGHAATAALVAHLTATQEAAPPAAPGAAAGGLPNELELRARLKDLENRVSGAEAPSHRRALKALRHALDDGSKAVADVHTECEKLTAVMAVA